MFKQTDVAVNGLTFHCLVAGNGPLILCLHGFPETPETFEPLAKAFVLRGYRVVAPYARGYSPSSSCNRQDYSLDAQARDALGLIEHFSDRAILIGHDWGSITAQLAASLSPDKVSRLICLSFPVYRYLRIPFTQILKSWYIFFFYIPLLPELVCTFNNYAFIHWLRRSWSPQLKQNSKLKRALEVCLKNGSLKPALTYYRRLHRNEFSMLSWKIKPAYLTIAGMQDSCINSASFGDDPQLILLPGIGHHPHLENTALTVAIIEKFLQSNGSEGNADYSHLRSTIKDIN